MSISFDDWQYHRSLGALTNPVSWVDLTPSNFVFAHAKSAGEDIRIYDVDGDAILPLWLMDYSQSGRTGRAYFKASNVAHSHQLYYGNPGATAVSSFAGVFTGGSGFDADFGDLTTGVGSSGYASRVPASTGPNDPRNYRVWSLPETPALTYAQTGLGGAYTGVREMNLVRDAVTNLPITLGGKYYITFARRSNFSTDKLDGAIASGPSVNGPWSNFSVFYTPPGTNRLGYPSSVIKVGSTYVCHITQGWHTGGGSTPGLTVYVMTSSDLVTWTSPTLAVDSSIWTDPTDGQPVSDAGNPWVIRCADGVYAMVVEGHSASGVAGWACFGATAADPINGPWTALNSGNSLMSVPASGDWDFGGLRDANPKIFQQPDGSYVMPFNGSDVDDGEIADWQLGFATAPARGGPWTKAAYNPVGGRIANSYGFETASFHLDTDGTTLLNFSQRFGDEGTGSSAAATYRIGALLKAGGLLVSAGTADAAWMGRPMAAGTFTAESRSIFTAHRATNATPILLGLWDYASLPAVGAAAGFAAKRCVEIVRWSHDAATPGDFMFKYLDTSAVTHYWTGSAWTTTSSSGNLAADHGREVVAKVSDDGTNFVMSATYADDGSPIASASIAKSSVMPFGTGRLLVAGDPFTNAWGSGLFFRYLHVRPYAASDPAPTVGPEIERASMAQGSFWTTQRAGNWSRPITFHDSPWWASDEEDAGLTGFYPGDGSTVIVHHNLTVDADIVIGLSLQAAIWEPLGVSTSAGSAVTLLPTGTYTASASVFSAKGETQVGNTATANIVITNGTSRPRITFAQAPPAGCSYRLYLDQPSEPGHRDLYCQDITGTTVDLVSDKWLNTWTAGVATGGAVTIGNSTSPIPPDEANAITVAADGRIIIASGNRLLVRGDLVVESPTGSSKQFVQVGNGATFRTDPSLATDPTRAEYLMWFQGGGDIHFMG